MSTARYQKRNKYLRHIGRPPTVPKTGTVRRIRALQALGWTVEEIAAAAGVDYGTLRGTVRIGNRVYRSTAERVAAAYERLHMIPAPDSVASRRARAMAKRRGWEPPLAWNDIDYDQAPITDAASRAKAHDTTLEDFDWLISQGESPELSAARVGVSFEHSRSSRFRAGGGSE